MKRPIILLALIALFLVRPGDVRADQPILETVRERGYVKCAIGNRPVGDTRIGETGYEGFFPEFCRAVALALFDDRSAVELSPTLIRFGLQSISEGDVDIYISNVTWTYSRDLALNLLPAAVLYYDGQGFMSHEGTLQGDLTSLKEANVCVSRATTTIGNLKDFISVHDLDWTILPFESSQGRNDAFFARQCDLLTTDRFALATLRATVTNTPSNYVLHEDIISKEPLVAYVRATDAMWANLVRWVIYAMISAEELGITSSNYSEFLNSRDPEIRRLLGLDETEGTKAAGLDPDWARRVISGAGNYGEIFDRYLGTNSNVGLDRGLNRLWKHGGLMYSPPFR